MSFSAESLLGLTVAGRYEILQFLGAGGYGTVFKAIDLDAEDGPSHYAIKAMREPEVGSVEELLLEREVTYHERVTGHDNVVSFYEVFNQGGWVFLLLELSEAETLHEFIADSDVYDSDDRDALIKTIYLDVIDAVGHCHRQHVFHRDLKPENILCARDGSNIRIADFGLATDENISMQKMCGTKGYLPPGKFHFSLMVSFSSNPSCRIDEGHRRTGFTILARYLGSWNHPSSTRRKESTLDHR